MLKGIAYAKVPEKGDMRISGVIKVGDGRPLVEPWKDKRPEPLAILYESLPGARAEYLLAGDFHAYQ